LNLLLEAGPDEGNALDADQTHDFASTRALPTAVAVMDARQESSETNTDGHVYFRPVRAPYTRAFLRPSKPTSKLGAPSVKTSTCPRRGKKTPPATTACRAENCLGRTQVSALSIAVSFDVKRGEALVLVGESGCG